MPSIRTRVCARAVAASINIALRFRAQEFGAVPGNGCMIACASSSRTAARQASANADGRALPQDPVTSAACFGRFDGDWLLFGANWELDLAHWLPRLCSEGSRRRMFLQKHLCASGSRARFKASWLRISRSSLLCYLTLQACCGTVLSRIAQCAVDRVQPTPFPVGQPLATILTYSGPI